MRTVAYLGPEQTYTHLAAKKKFGKTAKYFHAPTIEDVFRAVEDQQADCGVVPIENSLEGAVTYTLDRFIRSNNSPVRIHGEFEMPVKHYFISYRGIRMGNIRVVYSHPQALAQCNRWLHHHLPRAERWETNSTAEAGEYLCDKSGGGKWKLFERAAIGRRTLASKGANLIASPIPQERENKTRFLLLGLGEPKPGRTNKTSILFALKDKPGALHDALMPFKRNRINLTKIESRPSKRKAWEYVFFLDIEGHASEPSVQRSLKALEKTTSMVRILGSYPMASGSRKSPE